MGDAADLVNDWQEDEWSKPLWRHPAAAPGVWIDQRGHGHLIEELDIAHLRNVLNWLTRQARAFGVQPAQIAGRVRLGRLRKEARKRALTVVAGKWT